MHKWLPRVLAVAIIGLLTVHIVLDMAGIPPAEQRPARVALMAVVSLWVAMCVGRSFIRPESSPAPGRSEAGCHGPSAP